MSDLDGGPREAPPVEADEPDRDIEKAPRRLAWRVAILYALIGSGWILFTDLLVNEFVRHEGRGVAQTIRGFVFIAGSAALLYLLVRVLAGERARAHEAERQERRNLERSEFRYRHLVEMLPGVVYRNEIDAADPTLTRCVYISPQIHELLGYTPQE